jgi:hypothetical protein
MDTMRIDVPSAALRFGFVNDPVGSHTSRTVMLRELETLLASMSETPSYAEYAVAIVDGNVLHKATATTRRKTLRHLREFYGLADTLPVFAAMRAAWYADPDGRPIIAGLCATTRDPVMRATLSSVTHLALGESVTSQELADAVSESFPGHYGGTVIHRIGRGLASSWAQTGLLEGRLHKVRARPVATPVSVAYALYLGHLCGNSGDAGFCTIWSSMLDRTASELRSLAMAAARLGWLEYRESGGVTQMTFHHFESLNHELGQ